MRTESTPFLAGLTVLAVLAVLCGPPAAFAAAADGATADIPRTASGRPDLSGNYDLASLTPMQRNAKYGERRFLTKEEAEAIEAAAAAGMARADSASDPNREAPAAGGDGSGGAAGGVVATTRSGWTLAPRSTSSTATTWRRSSTIHLTVACRR